MSSKRILSVILNFIIILLNNSVNCEDEVVKLRTCCNLNPKLGNNKCEAINGRAENSGNVNLAATVGAEWEIPYRIMSTNETTIFQLSSEKLICSGGENNYTSYPESQMKFFPSGYLQITDLKNPFFSEFYHTSQYCINGISNTEVEFVTCKRYCTKNEPCIHKCCPPDSIYVKMDLDARRGCEDSGKDKYSPIIFETTHKQINEKEKKKLQPWYSLNPPPVWAHHCVNMSFHLIPFDKTVAKDLDVHETLRLRFLSEGKIVLWNNLARRWETFNQPNYCVDGILYQPGSTYVHKEEATFIITCPVQLQPRKDRDASLYYGIFASITCIFALITVIVYALLWEKQNVHGWTIMSHSTSVFFFFIFIAIAHFTKNSRAARTTWGCLFVATMAHYFFLSTFCWLAMISFDLWLTFRSITLSKGKGVKRFLGYSLFGWGIPLFIVCLSWTLELIYKDDDESEVPIPMYGVHMCYLTTYAFWEYIYAPCTILMCLNIIFFGMTSWKLYQFKKSTSYVLFLKLFFVVGILWVFEIISWAADKADSKWYWQIFDSLNCLSPVAIFVIFVMKYDVLNSLGSKYPFMRIICIPNMWILGLFVRRRPQTADESAALNMSKNNETKTSQFSESSVAER